MNLRATIVTVLVCVWILSTHGALAQSACVISRPHQEVHGGAASPIHGIDVLAAASGTSVDDDAMMDVRVSAAYGEVHTQSIAGVNIMEWTGHAIRFQAPLDAAPVVLSQLEYLPCQHCSNDTLSVSCSKRSGASTEGHYAATIGMTVTPVATSSTLLLRATHDWWEVPEDTTSPILLLYVHSTASATAVASQQVLVGLAVSAGTLAVDGSTFAHQVNVTGDVLSVNGKLGQLSFRPPPDYNSDVFGDKVALLVSLHEIGGTPVEFFWRDTIEMPVYVRNVVDPPQVTYSGAEPVVVSRAVSIGPPELAISDVETSCFSSSDLTNDASLALTIWVSPPSLATSPSDLSRPSPPVQLSLSPFASQASCYWRSNDEGRQVAYGGWVTEYAIETVGQIEWAEEWRVQDGLSGPADAQAAHKTSFGQPVPAQRLRIRPRKFSGFPALRFEVYGCPLSTFCSAQSAAPLVWASQAADVPPSTALTIIASSEFSPVYFAADRAALVSSYSSCWLPDLHDADPFIQVTFRQPVNIWAVAIAGDPRRQSLVGCFTCGPLSNRLMDPLTLIRNEEVHGSLQMVVNATNRLTGLSVSRSVGLHLPARMPRLEREPLYEVLVGETTKTLGNVALVHGAFDTIDMTLSVDAGPLTISFGDPSAAATSISCIGCTFAQANADLASLSVHRDSAGSHGSSMQHITVLMTVEEGGVPVAFSADIAVFVHAANQRPSVTLTSGPLSAPEDGYLTRLCCIDVTDDGAHLPDSYYTLSVQAAQGWVGCPNHKVVNVEGFTAPIDLRTYFVTDCPYAAGVSCRLTTRPSTYPAMSILRACLDDLRFTPPLHMNGDVAMKVFIDDNGYGSPAIDPSTRTAQDPTPLTVDFHTTIAVEAVNDPPIVRVTAMPPSHVWSDQTVGFGSFSIDDADLSGSVQKAEWNTFTATVECRVGHFDALAGSLPVTAIPPPPALHRYLMIGPGTRDDVTTMLHSVVYRPPESFEGEEVVQIRAADGGVEGRGGNLTTTFSFDFVIETARVAANLPTIALDHTSLTAKEDTAAPLGDIGLHIDSDLPLYPFFFSVEVDQGRLFPHTWGAGRPKWETSPLSTRVSPSDWLTQLLSVDASKIEGIAAAASMERMIRRFVFLHSTPHWSSENGGPVTVTVEVCFPSLDDRSHAPPAAPSVERVCRDLSFAITVEAVNDPPSVTSPLYPWWRTITGTEDAPIALSSFVLSDPDAAFESTPPRMTLTVSASFGSVSVDAASHAVTVDQRQGPPSTLALVGTLAALQNALATLVYRPPLHGNHLNPGLDSLCITLDDGGVAGTIDAEGVTTRKTTACWHVATTPSNSLPTIEFDVALVGGTVGVSPLSVLNGLADGGVVGDPATASLLPPVAVSDIDAEEWRTSPVEVDIHVDEGTIGLMSEAGVLVKQRTAHRLVLSGSLLRLNECLQWVHYWPPSANFSGTDTLTVSVQDFGYTGSEGSTVMPAPVTETLALEVVQRGTVMRLDVPPNGALSVEEGQDVLIGGIALVASSADGPKSVRVELTTTVGELSIDTNTVASTAIGASSLTLLHPLRGRSIGWQTSVTVTKNVLLEGARLAVPAGSLTSPVATIEALLKAERTIGSGDYEFVGRWRFWVAVIRRLQPPQVDADLTVTAGKKVSLDGALTLTDLDASDYYTAPSQLYVDGLEGGPTAMLSVTIETTVGGLTLQYPNLLQPASDSAPASCLRGCAKLSLRVLPSGLAALPDLVYLETTMADGGSSGVVSVSVEHFRHTQDQDAGTATGSIAVSVSPRPLPPTVSIPYDDPALSVDTADPQRPIDIPAVGEFTLTGITLQAGDATASPYRLVVWMETGGRIALPSLDTSHPGVSIEYIPPLSFTDTTGPPLYFRKAIVSGPLPALSSGVHTLMLSPDQHARGRLSLHLTLNPTAHPKAATSATVIFRRALQPSCDISVAAAGTLEVTDLSAIALGPAVSLSSAQPLVCTGVVVEMGVRMVGGNRTSGSAGVELLGRGSLFHDTSSAVVSSVLQADSLRYDGKYLVFGPAALNDVNTALRDLYYRWIPIDGRYMERGSDFYDQLWITVYGTEGDPTASSSLSVPIRVHPDSPATPKVVLVPPTSPQEDLSTMEDTPLSLPCIAIDGFTQGDDVVLTLTAYQGTIEATLCSTWAGQGAVVLAGACAGSSTLRIRLPAVAVPICGVVFLPTPDFNTHQSPTCRLQIQAALTAVTLDHSVWIHVTSAKDPLQPTILLAPPETSMEIGGGLALAGVVGVTSVDYEDELVNAAELPGHSSASMDVWLEGGLVFVTPLPSLCTVAVTATGLERLSLLSSQVSHPTALTITARSISLLRDCLSDLTIAAPPTLSPWPSSTARVLLRSPGSNEAALSVTLTAVNQPPTLTAAHPVVFVSAGRTVSIGSKASITFADDGMGGGGVDRLEVEVRVTGDGTVALAPSAPVSPTTAEYRPLDYPPGFLLAFQGTAAQVAAALQGLEYASSVGYRGSAGVDVTVVDDRHSVQLQVAVVVTQPSNNQGGTLLLTRTGQPSVSGQAMQPLAIPLSGLGLTLTAGQDVPLTAQLEYTVHVTADGPVTYSPAILGMTSCQDAIEFRQTTQHEQQREASRAPWGLVGGQGGGLDDGTWQWKRLRVPGTQRDFAVLSNGRELVLRGFDIDRINYLMQSELYYAACPCPDTRAIECTRRVTVTATGHATSDSGPVHLFSLPSALYTPVSPFQSGSTIVTPSIECDVVVANPAGASISIAHSTSAAPLQVAEDGQLPLWDNIITIDGIVPGGAVELRITARDVTWDDATKLTGTLQSPAGTAVVTGGSVSYTAANVMSARATTVQELAGLLRASQATYTPPADFSGTQLIDVVVRDLSATTAYETTATLPVVVTATPDPPSLLVASSPFDVQTNWPRLLGGWLQISAPDARRSDVLTVQMTAQRGNWSIVGPYPYPDELAQAQVNSPSHMVVRGTLRSLNQVLSNHVMYVGETPVRGLAATAVEDAIAVDIAHQTTPVQHHVSQDAVIRISPPATAHCSLTAPHYTDVHAASTDSTKVFPLPSMSFEDPQGHLAGVQVEAFVTLLSGGQLGQLADMSATVGAGGLAVRTCPPQCAVNSVNVAARWSLRGALQEINDAMASLAFQPSASLLATAATKPLQNPATTTMVAAADCLPSGFEHSITLGVRVPPPAPQLACDSGRVEVTIGYQVFLPSCQVTSLTPMDTKEPVIEVTVRSTGGHLVVVPQAGLGLHVGYEESNYTYVTPLANESSVVRFAGPAREVNRVLSSGSSIALKGDPSGVVSGSTHVGQIGIFVTDVSRLQTSDALKDAMTSALSLPLSIEMPQDAPPFSVALTATHPHLSTRGDPLPLSASGVTLRANPLVAGVMDQFAFELSIDMFVGSLSGWPVTAPQYTAAGGLTELSGILSGLIYVPPGLGSFAEGRREALLVPLSISVAPQGASRPIAETEIFVNVTAPLTAPAVTLGIQPSARVGSTVAWSHRNRWLPFRSVLDLQIAHPFPVSLSLICRACRFLPHRVTDNALSGVYSTHAPAAERHGSFTIKGLPSALMDFVNIRLSVRFPCATVAECAAGDVVRVEAFDPGAVLEHHHLNGGSPFDFAVEPPASLIAVTPRIDIQLRQSEAYPVLLVESRGYRVTAGDTLALASDAVRLVNANSEDSVDVGGMFEVVLECDSPTAGLKVGTSPTFERRMVLTGSMGELRPSLEALHFKESTLTQRGLATIGIALRAPNDISAPNPLSTDRLFIYADRPDPAPPSLTSAIAEPLTVTKGETVPLGGVSVAMPSSSAVSSDPLLLGVTFTHGRVALQGHVEVPWALPSPIEIPTTYADVQAMLDGLIYVADAAHVGEDIVNLTVTAERFRATQPSASASLPIRVSILHHSRPLRSITAPPLMYLLEDTPISMANWLSLTATPLPSPDMLTLEVAARVGGVRLGGRSAGGGYWTALTGSDAVAVSFLDGQSVGSVTVSGPVGALVGMLGDLWYDPKPHWYGQDLLTIKVREWLAAPSPPPSGPGALYDQSQSLLDVHPINDPPAVTIHTGTTAPDATALLTVAEGGQYPLGSYITLDEPDGAMDASLWMRLTVSVSEGLVGVDPTHMVERSWVLQSITGRLQSDTSITVEGPLPSLQLLVQHLQVLLPLPARALRTHDPSTPLRTASVTVTLSDKSSIGCPASMVLMGQWPSTTDKPSLSASCTAAELTDQSTLSLDVLPITAACGFYIPLSTYPLSTVEDTPFKCPLTFHGDVHLTTGLATPPPSVRVAFSAHNGGLAIAAIVAEIDTQMGLRDADPFALILKALGVAVTSTEVSTSQSAPYAPVAAPLLVSQAILAGSPADIEAFFQGYFFVTPQQDYYGTVGVDLSVTDGMSLPAHQPECRMSFTIAVTAQDNDSPTITLPAGSTVSVLEDTATLISGVSVADGDCSMVVDGSCFLELNVTASGGAVNIAGESSESSPISLNGPAANINHFLTRMLYTPPPDITATQTVTFTLTRRLSPTSTLAPSSTSQPLTVTITAQDDPPAIRWTDGSAFQGSYRVIAGPSPKVFSDLVVSDVDGASPVGGAAQALVRWELTVDKGTLELGDTSGILFEDGTANDASRLVFRTTRTDAATKLAGLTLKWSAEGDCDIAVFGIGVSYPAEVGEGSSATIPPPEGFSAHHQSVLHLPDCQQTFTLTWDNSPTPFQMSEDSEGFPLRDDVVLATANPHLSFTVEVTPDAVAGGDILMTVPDDSPEPPSVLHRGGVRPAVAGIVTLQGDVTDIQDIFTRVRYRPPANYAGATKVTVKAWPTGTDPAATSLTRDVDITVVAVNDAPLLTLTPTFSTTLEGTATPLTFDAMALTDPDGSPQSVSISIAVSPAAAGVINMCSLNDPAVTITTPAAPALDGSGCLVTAVSTLALDVTDTAFAAIQATPANRLTFLPTAGQSGMVTLTAQVDDNGSGILPSAPLTHTATADVLILPQPENKPPVWTYDASCPPTFQSFQHTPLHVRGCVALDVPTRDSDDGPMMVLVQIETGASGVKVDVGQGSVRKRGKETGALEVGGLLEEVQQALKSIYLIPPTRTESATAAPYTGTVTVTLTAVQLGRPDGLPPTPPLFATTGALPQAAISFDLTISPLNTRPTLQLASPMVSTPEGTPATITGTTLQDGEALPTDTFEASLSFTVHDFYPPLAYPDAVRLAEGLASPPAFQLTFDGVSGTTVTRTKTLAAMQTALLGNIDVAFPAGWNGMLGVEITVKDPGTTGFTLSPSLASSPYGPVHPDVSHTTLSAAQQVFLTYDAALTAHTAPDPPYFWRSRAADYFDLFIPTSDTDPPQTQTRVSWSNVPVETSIVAVIEVQAVNDPPSVSILEPIAPPLTLAEDSSAIVGFTVSDPDVGESVDGVLVARLACTSGGIQTLNEEATVSWGTYGTLSYGLASTIDIQGTVAELNAFLRQMLYTPLPNYSGADALALTVYDNGYTGTGGNLTDTVTLNTVVTAVEDPPLLVCTSKASVPEGASAPIGQNVAIGDRNLEHTSGGPDDPVIGTMMLFFPTGYGTVDWKASPGVTVVESPAGAMGPYGVASTQSEATGTLADLRTGLGVVEFDTQGGDLVGAIRILARLTTALSPNTPVECSIDVFIEPTNDAPAITPSPNVPVSISLSGPLPYVEIVGFTVADIDIQPDLYRTRIASQTDSPALPPHPSPPLATTTLPAAPSILAYPSCTSDHSPLFRLTVAVTPCGGVSLGRPDAVNGVRVPSAVGMEGLTCSVGDGIEDAMLTCDGTLEALGRSLSTYLLYHPTGADVATPCVGPQAVDLSITVDDRGACGAGGPLSDVYSGVGDIQVTA
ncbi:unnamed protein product [Vitrella brassicaformis CCMP3155]|uniref:EGF-like domain-containing protein n=2 Tax=Vitrella brassicaformis TaxID=1169539 RepID=A0A0G4EZD3_VITBC|nr:unnamed protein product [Vitrella brassicaformis CCMP3155]|eukprot:CEM04679.1 unnamed protein product [Vitrella brassicaformis CCMP3155]